MSFLQCLRQSGLRIDVVQSNYSAGSTSVKPEVLSHRSRGKAQAQLASCPALKRDMEATHWSGQGLWRNSAAICCSIQILQQAASRKLEALCRKQQRLADCTSCPPDRGCAVSRSLFAMQPLAVAYTALLLTRP